MKKIYTTPSMRIFQLSAKDNVMLSTSNGEADPDADVLTNEDYGFDSDDEWGSWKRTW